MDKKRVILRNVATIIACLVVTVMFAACDKNNDDDNGGNGGGVGDERFVGIWVAEDPFTPTAEANEWVEYKADGSFNAYYYNTGISGSGWGNYTFSDPGTITFKGKYSVKDNKINLTNILTTWKAKNPQTAATKDFTDKSDKNMVWEYEFWDSGYKEGLTTSYTEYKSLKIKGWTTTGGKRYFNPKKASGIELFPKELPAYLCPTGLNGVAQSSSRNTQVLNMFDIADLFGKDYNYTINFDVIIHKTTMNSLQSYCNTLTSNGFSLVTLSQTWLFEGNITVKGIAYRVDIAITEQSGNVFITYTFR